MSSDMNTYLSSVKWGDSSYELNEFANKFEFAQIGKIVKGQYMNVGVPSLSSPSLNQIAFWAKGGKRVKVIAQCVRFKEGRNSGYGSNGRVVPIGPKLAIPDNYDGWWEILSEEGKSVRCIESIAELAKRLPESCLVRENIKVHLSKHDDSNAISDKIRTIQTGEILKIISADIVCPNAKSIISNSSKYLRCVSSKGDTIYMNMDQKGKFSAIAKEDNISGVHTMKNLLSKRLPLMVRLVHGRAPQGLKHFHSDMRLFNSYEEECILAMPLSKDTQNTIEVPINSTIKLLAPKNVEDLCKLPEYSVLIDLCKNSLREFTDRIYVLNNYQLKNDKTKINAIKSQAHLYDHKKRLQSNYLVKRSLSDPQQLMNSHVNTNEELKRGTSLEDNNSYELNGDINNENDYFSDKCYEEIDHIYDYVRGFAPLPERIKSDFECYKPVDPLRVSVLNDDNKPEPPPIETMPTSPNKRISYPTAIANITVNAKKANKLFGLDHIYMAKTCAKNELFGKTAYFPNVRISNRNNSTSRIYLPTTAQNKFQSANNTKLFIKSSSGQRNTWKANRFLKYAKHVSSPFRNECLNDKALIIQKNVKCRESLNNKTCRSSRSLTTSPIFNIRYKSMNNLHFMAPVNAMDFTNTLESSNSGQTSSGSGSKDMFKDPKSKFPKLSRSLTNIFWDMTGNLITYENSDKINNELISRKNIKNKQQIPLLPVHFELFSAIDRIQHQQQQQQQHHQQTKEQNCKRVTTLYL